MRKSEKKLALAKETLLSLEEAWTLKEVAGGETQSVCYAICYSFRFCLEEPIGPPQPE